MPGFSAQGGVHHRQERGGNEDETASPHVQGRGEGGDVADHPAADPRDRGVPPQPGLRAAGQHGMHALPLLGLFSRGKADRVRERRRRTERRCSRQAP